jgi:hypothetical protein
MTGPRAAIETWLADQRAKRDCDLGQLACFILVRFFFSDQSLIFSTKDKYYINHGYQLLGL